jgi:hypothetical protein
METVWGNFAEAAVRLLNLEPSCLPAVYVRFSASGTASQDASSIVVPMPKSRPELVSRFLKKLSFAAEDHADGLMSLNSFFLGQGLAGWLIPNSTQNALDYVLKGNLYSQEESWYKGGTQSAFQAVDRGEKPVLNPQEQARVYMTMEAAITHKHGWGLPNHEIAAAAESFLTPDEDRSGTCFYRPDLKAAVHLATVAHNMCDYGTVVRNIGATIEALFNCSLMHLVRGVKGVSLPHYVDHVDPKRGRIEVHGVPLNHPRHDIVGLAQANADECMTPWLAPALGTGTEAFAMYQEQISLPQAVVAACQEITKITRRMAHLRNPAAHGEVISREAADEAWRLLELLTISGQAYAMSSLRRGFTSWPEHNFTSFSVVAFDPQPLFKIIVSEVDEATCSLKKHTAILGASKANLERHSTQLKELERMAVDSNASLHTLLNNPVLCKAGSILPNWASLSDDHTALGEPERLAKAIARAASGRFTTNSKSDRNQIGQVSRIMKPDPDRIRSRQDIQVVIKSVELILEAGVVYARTSVDWRTLVRLDLERWLLSVATRNQVLIRHTPEKISETIRVWIEVLRTLVQKAEADVRESSERERDVRLISECAAKRLRAARTGRPIDCLCGSHK